MTSGMACVYPALCASGGPPHGVGSLCISRMRPRMASCSCGSLWVSCIYFAGGWRVQLLVIGAWCDMGRLHEGASASAFNVVVPDVCVSADAVCHRWSRLCV